MESVEPGHDFDRTGDELYREGIQIPSSQTNPTWEPNEMKTRVESRGVYNYASGVHIGTLRSQCWWIHDQNQVVREFGIVFKESIPGNADVKALPIETWQYLVGSDNARVVIQAEFAALSSYAIIQYYNLYGWGSYSVRYD